MRFMARGTAFKSHRCVLKGKWTALVTVALEAAWLVGGEALSHCPACASVRVVTIDAEDCAFWYSMVKRFLKLSHHIDVARGALLVDRSRLARHQPKWTVGVNLMTHRTRHLIFNMAALQTARMRRPAEVANQAKFVGRGGSEFQRIPNILSGSRFRVFLPRAMARFASLSLPAALDIGFNSVMGVPRECVADILMARSTGLGACIRGRLSLRGSLSGGIGRHHEQKCRR
jgi:hypothetical protein